MKNSDASSSSGFDDRPDACVKIGSPDGSEAVGYLAEDGAGAECLFRAVVCRRDLAVGDEDEEVLAEFLDNALKFLPGLGCRSESHDGISPPCAPRTVLEILTSYGSRCSTSAIH